MEKTSDKVNGTPENIKLMPIDDIDADLHHPESPHMSDQDRIDHLVKISDYITYGKVKLIPLCM